MTQSIKQLVCGKTEVHKFKTKSKIDPSKYLPASLSTIQPFCESFIWLPHQPASRIEKQPPNLPASLPAADAASHAASKSASCIAINFSQLVTRPASQPVTRSPSHTASHPAGKSVSHPITQSHSRSPHVPVSQTTSQSPNVHVNKPTSQPARMRLEVPFS